MNGFEVSTKNDLLLEARLLTQYLSGQKYACEPIVSTGPDRPPSQEHELQCVRYLWRFQRTGSSS